MVEHDVDKLKVETRRSPRLAQDARRSVHVVTQLQTAVGNAMVAQLVAGERPVLAQVSDAPVPLQRNGDDILRGVVGAGLLAPLYAHRSLYLPAEIAGAAAHALIPDATRARWRRREGEPGSQSVAGAFRRAAADPKTITRGWQQGPKAMAIAEHLVPRPDHSVAIGTPLRADQRRAQDEARRQLAESRAEERDVHDVFGAAAVAPGPAPLAERIAAAGVERADREEMESAFDMSRELVRLRIGQQITVWHGGRFQPVDVVQELQPGVRYRVRTHDRPPQVFEVHKAP